MPPEWSFAELARDQVSVFVPSLLGTMGAFVSMCVLQVWLARRQGQKRGTPPPEFKADFFWWLINPVGRVFSRFFIVGVVMLAMLLVGKEFHPNIFQGFGPVIEQPRWLMLAELFVLTDLTSYWSHRRVTRAFLCVSSSDPSQPEMVRWPSTSAPHRVNDLSTYCSNILTAMALGLPVRMRGGDDPA